MNHPKLQYGSVCSGTEAWFSEIEPFPNAVLAHHYPDVPNLGDITGIADLQSLIHIAESGWDAELQARENGFGMGVLSTLYFSRHLSVHSGTQAFSASTATIIRGDGIEVYAQNPRIGTEIRLDGVQSPTAGVSL